MQGGRVAAGAGAALIALGATTFAWLSTPQPQNNKLALYQAQCYTMLSATVGQLAKEGVYFKALEAYRTPQQAAWNAAQGTGVAKSAHTQSLAWDLARVMPDGTVSFKHEDYAYAGEVWKAVGIRAKIKTRWGGDFRRKDSVHFSCQTPEGWQ
jgi:hypothetical protein